MSDLKKYLILYSSENQQVAEEISHKLQAIGIESIILEKAATDYSEQMGQMTAPDDCQVVFLITDNFLKSFGCMNGILHAAHKWGDQNRLIAIVSNGVEKKDDGSFTSVSTDFERVGDIIQYMNYWQDKYLALRKEKRTRADDEDLEEEIATAKEISADVGEFLRYIRGLGYVSLDEFYENHKINNDGKMMGIALPEGASILESGDEKSLPKISKADERSLVEMIENSSEELMAENAELRGVYNEAEDDDDLSEEALSGIPGIDLLKEIEQDEDSSEQALIDELLSEQSSGKEYEERAIGDFSKKEIQKLDEENDELLSILDEVLNDKGLSPPPDKDEYHFVGDDPDNPGDFDIDSLFEEEESEDEDEETEDLPVSEDEVLLNLIEDENGEISSEEILEESVEYFRENQIDEGIDHLANAVKLRPQDTSLQYYHAYALARYAEDFDGAKTVLEKLLKQDSKHPDAWFLLGEMAENHQDFDGARKSFEKVVESTPDFPETQYRLGLLITEQFKGEEEVAAAHLKKAIQQNDQNVDALYLLATILNEYLDQPENSVKHFRKALNVQPNHPFANYDLAIVYHQLNDLTRAREYYLKAADINPELRTEQNDIAFGVQAIEHKTHTDPDPAKDAVSSVVEAEKQPNTEWKPQEVNDDTEGGTNYNEANKDDTNGQENGTTTEIVYAEKSSPVVKTKIVLITGATAGIGKATAEVFAKNGYRVILTGRRESRLEVISKDLVKKYNTTCQILAFDVRDPKSVEEAFGNLTDEWKNIDILINNAGLSRGLDPIHTGNLEDWEAMIDTNVKGLLYVTRAISPNMVERNNGHIINVSSIAGSEVYPGGNVYSASKAAVSSLTRSMRLDLHKHNVRVSQVSPGHVEETEFARVRFDWDEEKASKVYENFQPLKSSDVAETIFFIATRPAHVNIQDIYMYGTQQASATMIERSGR